MNESGDMSIVCTRTQQPAGQGGFHTGELCIGQTRLRYIYDCGSTKQDHIDTAVNAYANSLPDDKGDSAVDILFISHFDEDHIKGLKTLFGKVEVKSAVIPYIDEFERLYLYAAASSVGKASDEFRLCMSSPYQWLRDNGVKSIVVVGGDDEDDDDDGDGDNYEAFHAPIEPGADRPKILNYREEDSIPIEPGNDIPFSGFSSSKSEPLCCMSHRIPFTVAIGSAVAADWCFLTYVHPWEEKRKAFKKLIEQRLPKFAHKLNNDAIAEMLSDPKYVTILTKCYDDIWGKAKQKKNATTMSLYSGPRTPSLFSNTIARGKSGNFFHLTFPVDGANIETQQRAGWLLTGDAPIKEKLRLTPFLNHYFCIKDFVGVLMLPHHGSNANFNQGILGYFNAPIYSMAAGMSEYHPHATVQRDASAVGYVAVTSDSDSTALTFTSKYADTTQDDAEHKLTGVQM